MRSRKAARIYFCGLVNCDTNAIGYKELKDYEIIQNVLKPKEFKLDK